MPINRLQLSVQRFGDLSPSVALRLVAHHYMSRAGFEVRDYDPRWQVLFDEECERLRCVFGPMATIEHIGSTSVPGLAAKPIIDLLVGVQSLAEAKSNCVEPLRALRYTYIPEYEAWLPGSALTGWLIAPQPLQLRVLACRVSRSPPAEVPA